jgi:hypothetical protein
LLKSFMTGACATIIVACAVLTSPQPADAAYLHRDDARVLTYEIGVKLAKRVQADTWHVGTCTRRSAHHVDCALRFYGVDGKSYKDCDFTSHGRIYRNGSLYARANGMRCRLNADAMKNVEAS